MAKNCTPDQVSILVQCEVLDCFLDFLDSANLKSVKSVLDGLNKLFEKGGLDKKEESPESLLKKCLKRNKGLINLRKLETHQNETVQAKAEELFSRFPELKEF